MRRADEQSDEAVRRWLEVDYPQLVGRAFFTICNLQDGRSEMRKRQQIGRGLRLPVMSDGERCLVDDINLLTVIANEDFS